MTERAQHAAELLAVVIENAALRRQLADVQDRCVELAVDAGELHAEIEAVRAELSFSEQARDQWRAMAEPRFAG